MTDSKEELNRQEEFDRSLVDGRPPVGAVTHFVAARTLRAQQDGYMPMPSGDRDGACAHQVHGRAWLE